MNLQKKQTVEYTLTLSEDELVALGTLSFMIESVHRHDEGFYAQLPQDIKNRIHKLSDGPKIKAGGGWNMAPTIRLYEADLDLSWYGGK